MKKPTSEFEQIFIYLTGFNTRQDGEVTLFLIMDGFTEYAFEPIMEISPRTDQQLFAILEKCFNSILKKYNPAKHPEKVTYITNLPQELNFVIKRFIPQSHSVVFDADQTKKATKSLVDGFLDSIS